MAVNKLQVNVLHNNLYFPGTAATVKLGGAYAAENYVIPDNINNNLSAYVGILSRWSSADLNYNNSSGSNMVYNGYESYPQPYRPMWTFFTRALFYVDELNRYGYASTMGGGYVDQFLSTDIVNSGNPDYEPIYGHAAGTGWPYTLSASLQFRDSNNLPADGSATIVHNGSSYNRSKYLPACQYVAWITNTGTVGSGTVKFFIEQRLTYLQTLQTMSQRSNFGSNIYEIYNIFGQRALNSRNFYIHIGRFLTSDQKSGFYINQGNEDGTNSGVQDFNSLLVMQDAPPIKWNDFRTQQHAILPINQEYYAIIVQSKISIHSNKATTYPLGFYDLSTLWTSAVDKRIAGACVVNSNTIYLISGDGYFAKLDYSTTAGGSLSLLTSAPTLVDATEKYGALAYTNNHIYALTGCYSESGWGANVSDSMTIGVTPYDPVGGTWGSRLNSSLPGRHNTRSLRELMTLSDGKLALMVESIGNQAYSTNAMANTVPNTTVSYTNTGGCTLVCKLDGMGLKDSMPEFKIKIKFGTATSINKVVLKYCYRNAAPGTTYIGSQTVTFGGLSTGINALANTDLASDMITLPLSKKYDYFLYVYTTQTTINPYYLPSRNVTYGGAWYGLMTMDMTGETTTPNTGYVSTGTDLMLFTSVYNDVDTPVSRNAGSNSNKLLWQVMIYDPVGNVWNTSKIDASGNLACIARDNKYAEYYHNNFNASMISINSTALLIKPDVDVSNTYLLNYSGTPSALSNSNLINISVGQATTIYPGTIASTDIGDFIKNTTDNTVIFMKKADIANVGNIYFAHNAFNWDGTEILQAIPCSGTTTISKDSYFQQDMANGSNYYPETKVLALFSDTYLHIFSGSDGSVYEPIGHRPTSKYAANCGAILPRYYKWNGSAWVQAKNWADAAANVYTVPSTAGTAIPIVDGLSIAFGPASGNSFYSGDFYTINVTYGKVKYTRRVRYPWAFFAGKTFINSETRTMASQNAIVPHVVNPLLAATVNTTGPSGIVSNTGATTGYSGSGPVGGLHVVKYPKLVSGSPNDVPLVLEFLNWTDYTPSQVLTPLLDSSATTATASSSYGRPPYLAFNGHAAGDGWLAYGSTGWLQIDLGSSQTATNYIIINNKYTLTRSAKNWTLQGSNDGSTFTTLDTVTNSTGVYSVVRAIGTPAAYRYYRINITENNGDFYVGIDKFILLSSAPSSTINFTEIMMDPFCRGLKFEVDTGTGYGTITPIMRSAGGRHWIFSRQNGVQKLRITINYARNVDATYMGIGDHIELFDWGAQATLDAARLGSSAASDNTPTRGSFDTNCLGIASDVAMISIDGASPALLSPVVTDATVVQDFYTTTKIPTSKYRMHPFFGFILFEGAGDNTASAKAGTNVSVTYHWGRRV